MNRITIHAFDKDSSACYTETLLINKLLKQEVTEYEKRVPFSRYYTECECSDEPNTVEQKYIVDAGLDLD